MSRLAAAAALATVVSAAGSAPADAVPPRQYGAGFMYTSTIPGTATGIVTDFHFRNPDNPQLKPYAVARMVIRTPPGSGIDTTVRPRCHASDAQLQVEGPSACPRDTKVGGGTVVTDSGASIGPIPRESTTTISNFNGNSEIIGSGVNDDLALIKSVDRTKLHRNVSDTVFPVFPGVPPPDPYTPIKSLEERFPRYAKNGRPWARTPSRCPRSHWWTIVATFTYHDGVTQKLVSRSPCQPRRRPRPQGGGSADDD